jgi:cation diffusion facilitator family transporter
MDDCCSAKSCEIDLLRETQARVLKVVLAINAFMFVAQFTAGVIASSTALMADSVDMFGDATVYAMSLYALSRGPRWRAGAALAKGGIILAFGAWIVFEAVQKLRYGVSPTASLMGIFGFLALAANLTCLMLLWRFRRQDINMRSTFECSRNDVIANLGVLVAAAGVWATGAGWPDIAVGLIVAALFVRSAVGILREAYPQFRRTALPAE